MMQFTIQRKFYVILNLCMKNGYNLITDIWLKKIDDIIVKIAILRSSDKDDKSVLISLILCSNIGRPWFKIIFQIAKKNLIFNIIWIIDRTSIFARNNDKSIWILSGLGWIGYPGVLLLIYGWIKVHNCIFCWRCRAFSKRNYLIIGKIKILSKRIWFFVSKPIKFSFGYGMNRQLLGNLNSLNFFRIGFSKI